MYTLQNSLFPNTSTHHWYHNYDMTVNSLGPGGRLNKKDGLTRYGDSHVKDKTS